MSTVVNPSSNNVSTKLYIGELIYPNRLDPKLIFPNLIRKQSLTPQMVEKYIQVEAVAPQPYNQIDPAIIYKNIENNLAMSRLEESKNLTKGLRFVVRHLQKQGRTVRFPSPEAVDRLELKIAGLPTNLTELWTLIPKVFMRRDETISLQELYADFVTTHGRKAFDPAKSPSDCFYISYNR